MSMIYECPTCHAPQAAGRTACHNCGAEFDGAVPDDATLPEPVAAPEPAPAPQASVAPAALPPAQEPVMTVAAPSEEPPILQEVKPPPATPDESPVYQPAPFQPPPPYVPPPVYPGYPSAPPKSGLQIPKAVWIAVPLALVLVLGVVFFVNSLNGDTDTPQPLSTPGPVAAPPDSTPAAPGDPLFLSGGQSFSRAGNFAVTKWLVGRWQAKTTDYYVFNDDGTGLGGTVTGKLTPETFRWVLVQNQLILTGDKQQKLVLGKGAGDSSILLRGADGRYVEFSRAKPGT